jgi:hypothetical protein
MTMSEREELIRLISDIRRMNIDTETFADRILSAGYHNGPKLPEEGTPEEAAAVDAMIDAYFYGEGYEWREAKGADHVRTSMLAALRALRAPKDSA